MTVLFCLVYFFVPHLLKDFIRAEHAARIRREKVQDIELDQSQLDLLPYTMTLWFVFVDRESADRDLVLCRLSVLLFGFNWV